MRGSALAVLFVLVAASVADAQEPNVSLAANRADASFADAVADAKRSFERTQTKELDDWLAVYEQALKQAKSSGDPAAIAHLADSIARTKRAGRVQKAPPPGAKFFQGNAYVCVEDPAPWYRAKLNCERAGGHLAIVDSPEEEAFLIETFGEHSFGLGASDAAQEGDWRWIDGRPLGKLATRVVLDDRDGMQHSFAWNRRDRRWDDGEEGGPATYVCEWERKEPLAIPPMIGPIVQSGEAPQTPTARADAAYFAAVDQARERARLARLKAGGIWLRACLDEQDDATKAGELGRVRAIQDKIAAAAEAGDAPLPRPDDVRAFQRHDYALIQERMTWVEAKRHCERMGGHLLLLDGPAEESFVLEAWRQHPFFVGASTIFTPGTPTRLDGKPFQSSVAEFQTDNWKGMESAIGWSEGPQVWNDCSQGLRFPFVCEWD